MPYFTTFYYFVHLFGTSILISLFSSVFFCHFSFLVEMLHCHRLSLSHHFRTWCHSPGVTVTLLCKARDHNRMVLLCYMVCSTFMAEILKDISCGGNSIDKISARGYISMVKSLLRTPSNQMFVSGLKASSENRCQVLSYDCTYPTRKQDFFNIVCSPKTINF